MITGAALTAQARTWVGTPYVHQGRSRYGVDCIGFVICARDAAEPWPEGIQEIRNYARTPANGLLLKRVTDRCISLTAPEEGCLILIKWPLAKEPSHVGLYAGGNIIHAYKRVGKTIETGYRAHWLRDTHSWWRLPGVSAP